MNFEFFVRVGIASSKGVLFYGLLGMGKMFFVKVIVSNIDVNFLKIVFSVIVDKYIGEFVRLIREMFGYVRDYESCIIFMDEIDVIGGKCFFEGMLVDCEI